MARKATPARLAWKNHVTSAIAATAIAAATSLSLAIASPCTVMGAPGIGSAMRRGTSPRAIAAPPRRNAPRPSVTMISEMSGPPTGGRDLDEVAVEGARAGWRGAVGRQHVATAVRVRAVLVRREPRAVLDRDDAWLDTVGDARGQDRRAAIVEDTDTLAGDDPARGGVGGVDPHVVAIRALEDRLVAVDRVGTRPRLRRHQLQRMTRIRRVGNPRGNGRDR